MTMLSKVLPGAALEVKPVAWRRGVAAPAKSASSRNGKPPDEISRLRATLADFNAAAEQQARQAYEAGMHAGETAARQGAESEVRTVVEKLAATIADVAGTRAEVMHRAESDTVHLAIEIARRVLHREVSLDASALEGLVRAALEKLQAQEVYRVRVHPAQEGLVRKCLAEMGRGPAIEVVSDPLQPRGGAVFEIAGGSLDASVETQLSEIERGLADQLEARV